MLLPFSLDTNEKTQEIYAAALRRSVLILSFYEKHTLNCLYCSVKVTQDIILAIELAQKYRI